MFKPMRSMHLQQITKRIQTIKFELAWFNRKEEKKFPPIWINIILLTLLLMIVCIVFPYVQHTIHPLPQFQIIPQNLKVHNERLKLFVKEIAPIGIDTVKLNIFNPELPKALAESFLKNPWIAQIEQISITYPNYVHCRVQLRNPFGMIYHSQSQKYYLFSTDGQRLPIEYDQNSLPTEYALPNIFGITENLPEIGQKWNVPELYSTIQILSFLSPLQIPWNVYLEELPFESQKTIILKNGALVVLWGKGLENEIPNISKEKRFEALQKFFSSSIEPRGKEVDIRFGYCIVREDNFLFPHLISYSKK